MNFVLGDFVIGGIMRTFFLCLLSIIFLSVLFLLSGGISSAADVLEDKKPSLQLTPEELLYLEQHPRLRVSNEMDWPPFDFRENGKSMGFSVDYMKILAEITGFKFEFVGDRTWVELLEMFKRGELDILHPIGKTPERDKYIFYGDSPLIRAVLQYIPAGRISICAPLKI
ncbi:hypothetical protein D0S45_18330 [Marinifilum sp. JC120]|nr:hypothetical protein D0S45_18330 [Marinifilum sp. JC120]